MIDNGTDSSGNRLYTLYGHLSSVSVSQGQTVSQGQVIGYSGNTGNSYGAHLHFEVRVNGTAVNAMSYFN
jgi:murein DD-endopeptidase MepM/ murein hydrolase activator NlpD